MTYRLLINHHLQFSCSFFQQTRRCSKRSAVSNQTFCERISVEVYATTAPLRIKSSRVGYKSLFQVVQNRNLSIISRAKYHVLLHHSDVAAKEMMGSFSSILKLAVLLLASITSAYPPNCHPYFGRPNERHCHQLIHGPFQHPPNHGPAFLRRGIRNINQAHNFFAIVGVARPAEISNSQVSVLTPSLILGPLIVCPVPRQT